MSGAQLLIMAEAPSLEQSNFSELNCPRSLLLVMFVYARTRIHIIAVSLSFGCFFSTTYHFSTSNFGLIYIFFCLDIPNAHGEMDVERTVNRLAEISLNYAKAGSFFFIFNFGSFSF